jgi:hypothetical protein
VRSNTTLCLLSFLFCIITSPLPLSLPLSFVYIAGFFLLSVCLTSIYRSPPSLYTLLTSLSLSHTHTLSHSLSLSPCIVTNQYFPSICSTHPPCYQSISYLLMRTCTKYDSNLKTTLFWLCCVFFSFSPNFSQHTMVALDSRIKKQYPRPRPRFHQFNHILLSYAHQNTVQLSCLLIRK